MLRVVIQTKDRFVYFCPVMFRFRNCFEMSGTHACCVRPNSRGRYECITVKISSELPLRVLERLKSDGEYIIKVD